ncbi:origin recognition complex subunit 5 C-terminus-domain-containing protein [Catenaria anguillulae PL171]|uniref:Origin recognition complex subunit 5 C-terminus-domain-containing protein n=1 Tax=Catenaria anguillulae PL171 TaxID=765915 RepID=A0A1Y2I421_9FUNG|nr:origin recognition complex subunit 5 C-terminus-domain-containing protein [Catenaria anguillulae PL171]
MTSESPLSTPLSSVAAVFPHRSRQIATLDSLLTSSLQLRCPLPIFVHGAPATGKSTVLRSVVDAINQAWPHHAAYVSCRSAYSLKLVLSKIVRQWAPPPPANASNHAEPVQDPAKGVDNLCSFMQAVTDLVPAEDAQQRWMILDDAHFLLDTVPALVRSLTKTIELCQRNIVLVLASSRDWRSFSSLQPVLAVPFTPYSKAELVSSRTDSSGTSGYHCGLLRVIAEALVDSVRQYCTNLVELQSGMAQIMPKAQQLLDHGTVPPTELHRVFRHLSKEFGHFASTLYTGHTAPAPPPPKRRASSDASFPVLSSSTALVDHTTIDLPLASKYLLIAAYLASYNPVSLDRQFFAKAQDSSFKRANSPPRPRPLRVQPIHGRVTTTAWATHICPGSHAGYLSRNVNGEIENSVDVLHQVATLVALKYLTKVSATDGLDGFKCKCNVSLEVVTRLARSCGFDLGECLADPHQT